MDSLEQLLQNREYVPFIGMGVFEGCRFSDGGEMPFDGDSFIITLNNGRAMSPRLMYEYSRAAMSIEQRRGREYLEQMVKHIYSKEYELAPIYKALQKYKPKYVIDTNVDSSLQRVYSDQTHFLITGISRIGAEHDRFVVYLYDVKAQKYNEIDKQSLNDSFPILFQPMGSVTPQNNLIVSDADFVDWLTEAMAGYGMPEFLKSYRKGKEYLFLGVDFSKDTFRMVANELTMDSAGGAVVTDQSEFTKKQQRFFDKHGFTPHVESVNEYIKL